MRRALSAEGCVRMRGLRRVQPPARLMAASPTEVLRYDGYVCHDRYDCYDSQPLLRGSSRLECRLLLLEHRTQRRGNFEGRLELVAAVNGSVVELGGRLRESGLGSFKQPVHRATGGALTLAGWVAGELKKAGWAGLGGACHGIRRQHGDVSERARHRTRCRGWAASKRVHATECRARLPGVGGLAGERVWVVQLSYSSGGSRRLRVSLVERVLQLAEPPLVLLCLHSPLQSHL